MPLLSTVLVLSCLLGLLYFPLEALRRVEYPNVSTCVLKKPIPSQRIVLLGQTAQALLERVVFPHSVM